MTRSPPADDSSPAPTASVAELFVIFLRIGLFSFGGGLSGWVYREVVLLRPWLTESEFLSGLALGQILPGANITNLAVYVGQKMRGTVGAVATLAGLLTGPFFAVILLASVYDVLDELPYAETALDGVAAAAVGLILLIVLKGARRAARQPFALVAMLATFVMVGVLHWPMLAVVAVVSPVSVAAAWPRGPRGGSHDA